MTDATRAGAPRDQDADEFHDKTTRPNKRRLTGFTCLKVIGWSRLLHRQTAA
ncbi:hypothetical protein ACFMBG_21310 [Leisingera sp. D0M16]|uniref:hypothetical protein n=1 Tax=Leisingera coralii TaxID=3351347 RepID=UPI003B794F41